MIRLPMLESFTVTQYLNIVRDNFTKITYSQFGEDVVVLNLLFNGAGRVHGGFYVDVGAFHPRNLSTTQLLKLLCWRGINIDASEKVISEFNAERPEDINVCCGVGAKEGILTYYAFDDGASSTLCAETAKKWEEKGRTIIDTNTVNVRTINQILESALPIDTEIDYMNIDLEGLDRDVIATLDLSRFRPAIISIELHGADLLNLRSDETVSYLLSNGYVLESVNCFTFIFSNRK